MIYYILSWPSFLTHQTDLSVIKEIHAPRRKKQALQQASKRICL